MSDLRERVARRICCVNGECYRPDKCFSWTFGGEADAVLSLVAKESAAEVERLRAALREIEGMIPHATPNYTHRVWTIARAALGEK